MQVIAAIDQSTASSHALEYIKCLPCSEAMDLTLLSVAPPIAPGDLNEVMFANDIADIQKAYADNVQVFLNAAAENLCNQFKSVKTITLAGMRKREVVRAAMKLKADILLLGAMGRSTIARLLWGSTADYVATHAKCSTLVARPPLLEADNLTGPPKRVLIAVGHADADARLPQWIQRLGLTPSTEVHLVHVMEVLPSYMQRLTRKASAYWKEFRSPGALHIQELQMRLNSEGFSVKSAILEAFHIGQAIAKYADKHRCELIVTGDQRESLVNRLMLGSTSRYLLRHATSNLLIAREVDRFSRAD